MSRNRPLAMLIETLGELIALLERDPGNRWTAKFRDDLDACRTLLAEHDPDARELARRAEAILAVFGGMGSFNDYAPARYDPTTGRYTLIAGTERFEAIKSDVFDRATAVIANG